MRLRFITSEDEKKNRNKGQILLSNRKLSQLIFSVVERLRFENPCVLESLHCFIVGKSKLGSFDSHNK